MGVARPGARHRPRRARNQPVGRRVARRPGRSRQRGMTDIAYPPPRVRALRESLRALRAAEFPWTADTVYLNNASTGPIPERTRRALDEFTAKRTAPHLLPDRDLSACLAAARLGLGQLTNANPSRIALSTNTGFGCSLPAGALRVRQ